MAEKFRNKYRTTSFRLEGYNYAWAGAYFITICTLHRAHFFGRVVKGKVELSPVGKIVEEEWLKSPDIRPDMSLHLDEFVVMPNHFHGILIIGNNEYNRDTMHNNSGDILQCVSTPYKNQFGPQKKNLASIIRGFKSAVSIRARKINPAFGWQSLYYERIIRDRRAWLTIANYIKNNPFNWQEDRFRQD